MSRVGRKPIELPKGVSVAVHDSHVRVKGPEGEIQHLIHPHVKVAVDGATVSVTRASEQKQDKALHGLTRALLANAVKGVSQKFQRVLEVQGIGYRAQAEKGKIVFSLGYSHSIDFPIPKGIEIDIEKQTRIVVKGIDRQLVGQTAAEIRDLRVRDVYKGKGIRYEGEVVKLKAGKAGKTGA